MAKEAKVETLAAALAVCERERDTWAERAAAIEAGLEPAAVAVAVATEPKPEAVEPKAEAGEPDGGKSKKGSTRRSEWGTPKSEDEPEPGKPTLVAAVA